MNMKCTISARTRALLGLHLTVLLWGFTAILGKLITYSSLNLVWHRMVITFLVYLLIPKFWKEVRLLSFKQFFIFFGIGLIVCIHWIMFYSSIKLGDSASITLACLGSVSFFSSILEPTILQKAYSLLDIGLGCIVMVGILFIYFSLESIQPITTITTTSSNSSNSTLTTTTTTTSPQLAILTGLLASLLASLFCVLNKKYIQTTSSLVISTIEMGAGALILTIILPCIYREHTLWYPPFNAYQLHVSTMRKGPWDLLWVLILSIVCTNITFYLSNVSLQHLSAFTSNIIYNLEPVYGIILGGLLFHENKQLNRDFYIGASVIIIAVFLGPILDYYTHRHHNSSTDNDRRLLSSSDSTNRSRSGSYISDSSGSLCSSSTGTSISMTNITASQIELYTPSQLHHKPYNKHNDKYYIVQTTDTDCYIYDPNPITNPLQIDKNHIIYSTRQQPHRQKKCRQKNNCCHNNDNNNNNNDDAYIEIPSNITGTSMNRHHVHINESQQYKELSSRMNGDNSNDYHDSDNNYYDDNDDEADDIESEHTSLLSDITVITSALVTDMNIQQSTTTTLNIEKRDENHNISTCMSERQNRYTTALCEEDIHVDDLIIESKIP